MTHSARPRKASRVSNSLHQQLNMYALAAGAAGVGTLCLAKPAEARIVYTPAHVGIKANGGLFHIDLNHDGTPDFALSNSFYQGEKTYRTLKLFESRAANQVWVTNSNCEGSSRPVAAALPRGKRIGPKGEFKFSYGHVLMAAAGGSATCGVWGQHSNLQAYLGLKFTVKGKIHFGWARVKVDTLQRPFSATLTGYAYETIPGKAIIAGATNGPDDAEPSASFNSHPEPATLGALALGAPGLSIWRRKESAAAALAAN